jgi:ankyrin repeat protein
MSTPGGVDAADEHGWTPLHWASAQRKPEHVAALLDSGGNAHLQVRVLSLVFSLVARYYRRPRCIARGVTPRACQTAVAVGAEHPGGGERPAGTTAMQLSRFPVRKASGCP